MNNMKGSKLMILLMVVFCACKSDQELKPKDETEIDNEPKAEKHKTVKLYESEEFTVYSDRVVQGDNEARVISSEEITSNYRSPATSNYSNLINFKFSINEKDVELPVGVNHRVLLEENDHESPIITFGEADKNPPEDAGKKLAPNHQYTFRVDMNPVLEAFKEKGFYEAYDGTRIAERDFKGFYIAGGSEPLTWDFVNLEEKDLRLQDRDGDGIYEIQVNLNPYDPSEMREKSWKLSEDISGKPTYSSDQPIVDALFKLSTEEALKNIEPDNTLRTGAKWSGVWTRDISYSIYLAFAYHEPEIAKISLMKKVNRDRIIQDTGSGGAWPISSDRTVWALAAWEVYKVTGDKKWLRQSYRIIKNTLEDDYKTIRADNGLYKGESSFLDWREQTYPKWMSNVDIAESQNLGTNVVHYQANKVLAKMAAALGEPKDEFIRRAETIKEAVNEELWQEEKGYYGQYLYGRKYMNLSERFEALGESLAVIFDVADVEKANRIISESPVTPYGITSIYPQIPDIPPYHNNGIWPFVQSYWNLAAAKAGNEAVLNHGLAAIYRPAALFLSNYENFVAETGDFKGTEINSERMLWSIAGNLAMVHRLFMGMEFLENGLSFNPVIPKVYGGTKRLSDFPYRNAVLDITVKGYGNKVDQILLDGEPLENGVFEADISGAHEIEIIMANNDFGGEINLVENKFSLPAPQARIQDSLLLWKPVPKAEKYLVYKNGQIVEETKDYQFQISPEGFTEYKVSAIGPEGFESFTSEPLWFYDPSKVQIIELENYAPRSSEDFVNFSGKGFVQISTEKNREIKLPVFVPEEGDYLLDFRYSNGSGPWNTDNKAGIRSLYVNRDYAGTLVFPQRGQDEWSDWGFSNAITVPLEKGQNMIRLDFENWNNNMNVKVNRAMLDFMRLIPLTE